MKVQLIKQESNENRINSCQCGQANFVAINNDRKNKEKEFNFFKLNVEDSIKITEI